jgi:O-acetylhomoserine (thiol)-lyase
VYRTTSYVFRDAQHAQNLFALAEIGNIYTRIMNPTQGVLEARLSSLEGGITTAVGLPGALAVSSGQSAELLAILTLAEAGSHIVASPSVYGGTYNLFHYTLPKMGIEVTFVDDPDNLDQWKAAARPNTKAFFGEVLANPRNSVFDIEGVSKVAHEVGVPLIVDNTVPTPYLIRPLEWGADIVVHSLTKFIGGHGTSIGGAIIDGGSFDFSQNDKFLNFTEPDPSYHGLAYWPALGAGSYIIKARVQMLRDLGMATTPDNAFNFLQGLETLSLRMERHWANAQKVGEFLAKHPQVEEVFYAGLKTSKWHDRAVCCRPQVAQPRCQHWRCAQLGHSPSINNSQPAFARRAEVNRCIPRPRAFVGWSRDHRRHPRRPGSRFRSSEVMLLPLWRLPLKSLMMN